MSEFLMGSLGERIFYDNTDISGLKGIKNVLLTSCSFSVYLFGVRFLTIFSVQYFQILSVFDKLTGVMQSELYILY